MNTAQMMLTTTLVVLGLTGMPIPSQAFVCLPMEPDHAQGTAESWIWHHNLSDQLGSDCDSYLFLDPGQSAEVPLDDVVDQPDQDWHIEIKFDPSPTFAPCFRVFDEIYCPTELNLTYHLTWAEPAGQETVNAIARWTNTADTTGLGFDSSVAERDTDEEFPPHEDVGGFIVVDELPPDGAIVFELTERPVDPLTFEYAAKVICGTQADSRNLQLARGHYLTSVNILNLNDSKVQFKKSLALTYPPTAQEPGKPHAISTDTLPPRAALATDCGDLKAQVFPLGFPKPYIEGFVVVQSPKPLDVSAVYTAAALETMDGRKTGIGAVASIDVEQIAGRHLREKAEPLRPDLVPTAPFQAGDKEGLPGTGFCVATDPIPHMIRVNVRNIGNTDAAPSTTMIEFGAFGTASKLTPAIAKGANAVVEFEAPTGCYSNAAGVGCVYHIHVDSGNAIGEMLETNNSVKSLCMQRTNQS